jgi:hypothetical protein
MDETTFAWNPLQNNNLIAQEFYLPAQFHNDPQRSAEQRLMWACLIDAVDELMKYAGRTDGKSRHLTEELYEWFMDPADAWLFSFIAICHAMHLDPDYMRTGILRVAAQVAEKRQLLAMQKMA